MKKLLVISVFLATIALVRGQPVPGPSGEFIIHVNASTNLNANYLRVTGGKWIMDDKLTNWVINLNWEAWRTNNTPRIVDRGTLKLDSTQLKTLVNASNPKNALKNAILADAILVEKP